MLLKRGFIFERPTLLLGLLTFALGVSLVKSDDAATEAWATMPQPVTSFGAKVAGDYLYILGGHIGESHKYTPETTLDSFHRMDLNHPGSWEELPDAVRSQGVRLVVHDDVVYRVGGMHPVEGGSAEEAELLSLADFASFDPEKGVWEQEPDLPSPRSSHEAVLVGRRLFVVGGWRLSGASGDGVWEDTMYSIDLSAEEPAWETHPQPFRRRAISVATDGSKIYCIGGMGDSEGTSDEVDVYDVVSGEWTQGPSIPRGAMKGFGSAACSVNGRVVLSPYGGKLWTLSSEGTAWEEIGELTSSRFFHRLVPMGEDKVIAIAGASRRFGHLGSMEVAELSW